MTSSMYPEGTMVQNGVLLINATPHEVKFLNEGTGDEFVLQASGYTLEADRGFEPTFADTERYPDMVFYSSVCKPTKIGQDELKEIQEIAGEMSYLVIGSIISAEAYRGKVVALIPVKGQEREHPAKRQYSATRFNIF